MNKADPAETRDHRALYEYEFVWFNAWLYSGSDCLWASLIHNLHLVVDKRLGTSYTHAKLRAQFYSTLVLVAVSVVVVYVGVVYTRFSTFNGDRLTHHAEYVGGLVAIVSGVVVSVYSIYLYMRSSSISRSAELNPNAPSYKTKLGYMNTIKEELKKIAKLLESPQRLPNFWDFIFHPIVFELFPREWLPGGSATTSLLPCKIVIFVDDLDRCPPEKCVEVLQAVVLLMEKTPFILFLAIDPRVVVAAIESNNDKFYQKAGVNGFEFLEKIIQVIYIITRLRF